MKVSELEGAELDYWVAVTVGRHHRDDVTRYITLEREAHPHLEPYAPSTDWSQGGPIIEQFDMTLEGSLGQGADKQWLAMTPSSIHDASWAQAYGQTALVAAMRAVVACKYGEEVPQ